MKSEDELNQNMMDNGQKDNLDAIKQEIIKTMVIRGRSCGHERAGSTRGAGSAQILPERVDIVLAQDTSASFDAADRANLDAPFLADLDAALAAGGATDAAYGITNFVDYPFGAPGRDLPFGAPDDVIYETDQEVTEEVAAAQLTLDGLPSGIGVDEEEAQLVALQQIALRAEDEIGFRPDAERFVVLATDAPFHEAGDYPEGVSTTITPIWRMALVQVV